MYIILSVLGMLTAICMRLASMPAPQAPPSSHVAISFLARLREDNAWDPKINFVNIYDFWWGEH